MDKGLRAKALRLGESRLHSAESGHLRQGCRPCESRTDRADTHAQAASDTTWALLDMAAGLMRVSDADIAAALNVSPTLARMLRIGARPLRYTHLLSIHARLPRLWTGMLFLDCARGRIPTEWVVMERAFDGQSFQEAA